jgi:hypothetical protein
VADKNSKDRQGRVDKQQAVPSLAVYQPVFDLNENQCLGLGDKKIGQRVQVIIDYQVIEKTKSYCVLRVNSSYLRPSMRAF